VERSCRVWRKGDNGLGPATQALTSDRSSARTTPPPVASTALALVVPVYTTRRSHASASAVILRNFLLKPSGILFGMHPTEARIMIIAAAAAPLKVCPFGAAEPKAG
jgi:hypothetical protein